MTGPSAALSAGLPADATAPAAAPERTLDARGAGSSELPISSSGSSATTRPAWPAAATRRASSSSWSADALAQGADTLITTGAIQSNHCRQTAAAAAQAGLECHLVLGGQPPAQPNGNLLLDRCSAPTFHWTTRENRLNRLHELADELRAAGRRPYFITYGGSDPVGASGYALALEELLRPGSRRWSCELDAIVVASSSGGTQAGLVAGAWALGWDVPILGISIDEPEARPAGQGRRSGDAHRGPPGPRRTPSRRTRSG